MTSELGNILRVCFGHGRGAVKAAAEAAGAGVETSRNWFEERNAMSLTQFKRLCDADPVFRGEARRWLGMEANGDPEAERLMHELMRVMSKRMDKGRT